jgi:NADH-quinone oxidoreductase subunit I
MGSNHDISTYTRDGCIVDYAKLPLAVAWGQATLNPTAVQESKRVSLPVWTKTAAPPAAAEVGGQKSEVSKQPPATSA